MRKHGRGMRCPGSCVLLLFAYPSYSHQAICRFAACVLLLFAQSFDFVNKVFTWGISVSVILWNYNTSCWKILTFRNLFSKGFFFFGKQFSLKEQYIYNVDYLWNLDEFCQCLTSLLIFFLYLCVFIWLDWVLVVACRIYSSGMWDPVPWPGIKGPLHVGAGNLTHWTTRKVPTANILNTISGHEHLLAVISVHLISRVIWDLCYCNHPSSILSILPPGSCRVVQLTSSPGKL